MHQAEMVQNTDGTSVRPMINGRPFTNPPANAARNVHAHRVRVPTTQQVQVADIDLAGSVGAGQASAAKYVVVGQPRPQLAVDMTNSIPLQVWEGVVEEVDEEAKVFHATLRTRLRPVSDHIVEISTEWVSEQDRELLATGAVFYLTLYKEVQRGGTIKNAQELRFRRMPAWTSSQAKQVREQGKVLLSRIQARPIAE